MLTTSYRFLKVQSETASPSVQPEIFTIFEVKFFIDICYPTSAINKIHFLLSLEISIFCTHVTLNMFTKPFPQMPFKVLKNISSNPNEPSLRLFPIESVSTIRGGVTVAETPWHNVTLGLVYLCPVDLPRVVVDRVPFVRGHWFW